MAMDLVTLLLLPFAVARVTRLITTDVLFDTPRIWAMNQALRLGDVLGEKMAYLLTCPWCASVYVGAGGAAAWWAWGGTRWLTAVVIALTGSYMAGFLASREGE